MGFSRQIVDVVVLGAGAAGMMAALEAGRRGRNVLVLDHGERAGRKILISGGGRCNFTNLRTSPENFLSENPHFARSALARYQPQDFVHMVERHGIAYHEKTLGQLFCNDSAKRIVTMLEQECGAAGVDLRCGVRVTDFARLSSPGMASFSVQTSSGSIECASVVVATGGLSIPKMGATGIGYDLARALGHEVVPPRAALVPLVFAPAETAAWCDLTGISLEVSAAVTQTVIGHKVRGDGAKKGRAKAAPQFREKLLMTHRGLSGPAVLQISSYWQPGRPLTFDLAPETRVLRSMIATNGRRDASVLVSVLKASLPARFADRWAQVQLRGGEDWTNQGLEKLEQDLHAWTVLPAGTEGFAKAEVTAGGVDTREIDARTMESRRVPGLYFVGEVVDVTGWLGGYNFQWAWASGVAAGSVA